MRIATQLSAAAAGVVLTFGITGLVTVHHLREVADATTSAQAKNVARVIAGMVTYEALVQVSGSQPGQPVKHTAASLQNIVNFIAVSSKYDVEIFDAQKTTIADVALRDIGKPLEPERETPVEMTLKDGVARAYQLVNAEFPNGTRQVVVPVKDVEHRIIAALVLDYTPLYEESMMVARSSLESVVGLTLGALLLSMLAGSMVARRISRPIERLRDAATALAEGKPGLEVDVATEGEIGELARAFNVMTRSLGASRAALQSRACELAQANSALHEEIAIRTQVEQSLHLRTRAIESSLNAILIVDLTKQGLPIIYVNAAYERITGYKAREAVGRNSEFLLADDLEQPEVHAIRSAVREHREWHGVLRTYRKDGRLFWSELHIAPVRDEQGVTGHYVAVLNDITAARVQTEQLAYQANFDALTGLANRSLLLDRLGQAIVNSSRRGDRIAVLFIDLDGFKLINDTLGHDAGDELLKQIAERLKASIRQSDTVARLGGDEFVILLLNQEAGEARNGQEHNAPRIPIETFITGLTQKLLAGIGQSMLIEEQDVRVSGSIGISLFPQDGTDAETLLKNADIAMYRAKELGRDGFQFFTGKLHERVRLQMELGSRLRLALEREEFELHYQPQVSLRSGKIVGVETLVRWRQPGGSLVRPGDFIEFAEQSGLILPIGEWIMLRACAQNKAWQDAGLPAVPIAVNVSARQCAQQDIVGIVKRALAESGLEARYLEIELTESLSMADPEKSVPLMNRLKEIGVKLAIDDFGTGYSNMSYLKRFPIDRLKLDISFVREITTDAGSLAISDAIITMSHSLHLEVVAEGVETEGQLELLKARRCDLIQGYYFSPPLPAGDMAALMRQDRRLSSALTGRSAEAPAILALDDDPNILKLLRLNLHAEYYTLLLCDSAIQAFELLARHEIAVVLCDQQMPGMLGVDFLTAVRKMYPDTVRILMSAYEDFQVTRQAINAGAVYKFIEKPWQREQLMRTVDDAFESYLNKRRVLAG
jgi:diguanylate cyclase (GGDEF)-like protein/PAS domain S-box-containing protein